MPLNPVQFGKNVIDQFGRYLLTTFPVAAPGLRQQFKEGLSFGLGGKERLAKGYILKLSVCGRPDAKRTNCGPLS